MEWIDARKKKSKIGQPVLHYRPRRKYEVKDEKYFYGIAWIMEDGDWSITHDLGEITHLAELPQNRNKHEAGNLRKDTKQVKLL